MSQTSPSLTQTANVPHEPYAAADPTLVEDLKLLSEEAKVLAQAEIGFQKARAAYAGQQIKSIVTLLVVALVLVFFAVMALVVGLVIALGPVLGAWGAMALVTFGLFLLAGLCAFVALRAMKTMKRILTDKPSKTGARKDLPV